MRVLLVHSMPIESPGGAEISLRDHVAHAPPGVSVECVLPDNPVDVDRFDAVILANLRPTARFPKGTAGSGVEALACGCRVLASSRVGAISWPDPLEACRRSNRLFWEMVTNVPQEKNPRRFARRGGTD
jgi:hypothetical protein